MATNLKNLSTYSPAEIADAATFKIGIVTAEWNDAITMALLRGVTDTLKKHNCPEANIKSVFVPGTYELTSGAQLLLESETYDAVICLGCVIQGETRHFDFICQAAALGITELSIKYKKPVIFGVLTTNDAEQAKERAGGKHGNKGVEAAVTAIKMVALAKDLNKRTTIAGFRS